jgi:hypothetical protein
MHLTNFVAMSGVVQNPFRGRGFTRINMRHDTNVTATLLRGGNEA